MMFLISSIGVLLLLILAGAGATSILLRRVVPTNMVHIVQYKKKTLVYGRGKEAGNVYYKWPSWVLGLGVSVSEFQESIFQVVLKDYEAYDDNRVPFVVDVTAFFRVNDAEIVAQRVESFAELDTQLHAVLQGAVRRILATNNLEHILQSRKDLADKFTNEVRGDIEEWGVRPAKTIEFMDIRDGAKGVVIANIMAKETSRIEKDSRIVVANNKREAEIREIEASREIDLQSEQAREQVGKRRAEVEQNIGVTTEISKQTVAEQAAVTASKAVQVARVTEQGEADIRKNVLVINAEAEREQRVINAEAVRQETEKLAEADRNRIAQLAEAEKTRITLVAEAGKNQALFNAEGISAEGAAKATAASLMAMVPVDANLKLAKEIGENEGYQNYLIRQESVKGSITVGTAMAEALAKSDLKIISSGGDAPVLGSAGKLMDMFSAGGGTKIGAMLTGLAATSEGQAVINKLTGGAAAAE